MLFVFGVVLKADWDAPDWVQTFGTGSAHFSLFPSQPSEEQRKRWSMEDELRQARRIPLGFAQPQAVKRLGKKT